jgi:two-component system chemotaxis response regulator CheB
VVANGVGLIVVGTSLGGLEAMRKLLGDLPIEMPPIAVVQHRTAEITSSLVDLLQCYTSLPIVEPDDKTPIQPNHIYIAPVDYHLLVERGPHFALSIDPPVRHARPSIDVLFESAADVFGDRTIAVVLTCASDDGADGAAAIRRRGGRVLVQDPSTALAPTLPQAALERAGADRVVSIDEMASALLRACDLVPRSVDGAQ